MSERLDFDRINAAALADYPGLLFKWFPNGKREGHEFRVGNLRGDPGKSLSININTGEWADFATGDAKGGDPVSLYAAAFGHNNQSDAARALGSELKVYMNGEAPRPRAQPKPESKPTPKEIWRPMVPPPPDAPPPPEHELTCDVLYDYVALDGSLLFYVRRFEARKGKRKQFYPLTYGWLKREEDPQPVLGWHAKHPDAPRPLYGLNRLRTMPTAVQRWRIG